MIKPTGVIGLNNNNNNNLRIDPYLEINLENILSKKDLRTTIMFKDVPNRYS